MNKKRGGFLRHRPGEPDRYATIKNSDVNRLLDLASNEPDQKRAEGYRISAQVARVFERWNKKHGVHNRGRPEGSTREQEDAAALAFMEQVEAETGETRPYRLARLAVNAGLVPVRGTEKSRMDRLAGRWKRRIQKLYGSFNLN